MLSSHLKRSQLLKLHDELHLCLSSDSKSVQKNNKVKWFGSSLVFIECTTGHDFLYIGNFSSHFLMKIINNLFAPLTREILVNTQREISCPFCHVNILYLLYNNY